MSEPVPELRMSAGSRWKPRHRNGSGKAEPPDNIAEQDGRPLCCLGISASHNLGLH